MKDQTLKINVSQELEKPKYDEWDIKNAVRTLIEAEQIKQNAELMALVAPELEKQTKATNDAAEILFVRKKGEKIKCQKQQSKLLKLLFMMENLFAPGR